MKLLAALLLAQSCFAAYTTVLPVTLDHTKIPNTDQTGFVQMLCANGSTSANCDATAHTNLAVTQLKTVANGGSLTDSNGYDAVWFSASNCTGLLNFELVSGSYSATTGAAEFHVQQTRSHLTDDVIYLCLGNAAITTYQGTVTTWSGSSYVAALHLQEIHGTVEFLNSASANVAPYCAQHVAPTLATSQTFKGLATGGSGTGGSCDDLNYPTGGAAWTLEGWVKTPTASGGEALWGFGGDGSNPGDRVDFFWLNDNKMYIEVAAANVSIPWTPDSDWHHFAVVYAGGGAHIDSVLFYKDGVSQTTSNAGTVNIPFNIRVPSLSACYGVFSLPGGGSCTAATPSFPWQGDADELRLSSVVRSADWIAAEYDNISSPSTFYSFGAPITPGGGIRHRVSQ